MAKENDPTIALVQKILNTQKDPAILGQALQKIAGKEKIIEFLYDLINKVDTERPTSSFNDTVFSALARLGREDIIFNYLMRKHNFWDLLFFSQRWTRGVIDIPSRESFFGKQLFHVAQSNEPVLIVGETGTGKEIMSQIIHEMSKRRRHNMVPINCAAVPHGLFESELFGYRKGAFTGAVHDAKGLIAEAKGSTLFLDEIGKTDKIIQAKLLRVIETKKFYIMGDHKESHADFRLIAAVHPSDLLPEKGAILPDLLWRLGLPYKIEIPPLRDRLKKKQGMPSRVLLSLLRATEKELDSKGKYYFDKSTTDILLNYDFPGNARELVNILKFGIIRAAASGRTRILAEDIDFINSERSRSQEAENTAVSPYKYIKLKDIVGYANKERARIVDQKLREVAESGDDFKDMLRKEYIEDGLKLSKKELDNKYYSLRNTWERITQKSITQYKKSTLPA